ncbi:MAG TPA: thioredoxin family protein [Bradyrhizobium sp.]
MEPHRIVSQDEWLVARKAHLAEEKSFTRARDALSKKRRELPWVKVDKAYVFDGPNGKETLADLFGGKSQLIVYHFMLGPDWEAGCPSCSLLADHFDGTVTHLAQRDVTFVVVSRAPLPQIEKFQRRMGWRFKWLSSFNNDFNYDYQVSASPEEKATGTVLYNYEITTFPSEERPGASVFTKNEAGEVFHTYSSYGRGLDMLIGAYVLLDLAPKGRDEQGLAWPMAWVRHHDRYDGAVVDSAATFVEPKNSASCCD